MAVPEGQEPEEQDISQKRLIPTGINVPPTGVYLEELEHFIRCLAEDRDSDLVKEERWRVYSPFWRR